MQQVEPAWPATATETNLNLLPSACAERTVVSTSALGTRRRVTHTHPRNRARTRLDPKGAESWILSGLWGHAGCAQNRFKVSSLVLQSHACLVVSGDSRGKRTFQEIHLPMPLPISTFDVSNARGNP